MSVDKPARITSAYVTVCCIAVFLTFFLHELAHWLTGTALGDNMALSLNKVYPVSGSFNQPSDNTIISAAGPVFTILQAILFYLLLRVKHNPRLYPFLLTPLYMRVLAAGMSIIKPNDEARISRELGIGMFSIPVIVCLFLLWLVYSTLRQKQWPAKFTIYTLLLIMAFSSVLILADQFLKLRII